MSSVAFGCEGDNRCNTCKAILRFWNDGYHSLQFELSKTVIELGICIQKCTGESKNDDISFNAEQMRRICDSLDVDYHTIDSHFIELRKRGCSEPEGKRLLLGVWCEDDLDGNETYMISLEIENSPFAFLITTDATPLSVMEVEWPALLEIGDF